MSGSMLKDGGGVGAGSAHRLVLVVTGAVRVTDSPKGSVIIDIDMVESFVSFRKLGRGAGAAQSVSLEEWSEALGVVIGVIRCHDLFFRRGVSVCVVSGGILWVWSLGGFPIVVISGGIGVVVFSVRVLVNLFLLARRSRAICCSRVTCGEAVIWEVGPVDGVVVGVVVLLVLSRANFFLLISRSRVIFCSRVSLGEVAVGEVGLGISLIGVVGGAGSGFSCRS